MPVTLEDLKQFVDIADEAGQQIMSVYGEGGEVWRKNDDSPLTEADLLADQVIRRALEDSFPGVFILSEESVSSGTGQHDRFFLVDPLDGTKEFLKRNGEFTVNIALIERGVSIAGVVCAPALEECFFGARDLGSFKRDRSGVRSIKAGKPVDSDVSLRIIGSRSHGGDKLDAWLETLDRPYTFIGAGSSLKFCRIAEGLADVYPRFGPTSQWDTAAGQAVLEAAGGSVTDLHGKTICYGLGRSVLNPEFIAFGDQSLLSLAGSSV
jgi:3'(2'), 5'-bisphosphate nucleotidase